jgi:plasmid maintenance system antidote protein VapI
MKGRKKMTNIELLEEKIKLSGKKKGYLAERLGISRAGFRNLCRGKSQFRTEQVKILCEELNIVDAEEKLIIFFA